MLKVSTALRSIKYIFVFAFFWLLFFRERKVTRILRSSRASHASHASHASYLSCESSYLVRRKEPTKPTASRASATTISLTGIEVCAQRV